jgi:phosphopantothenoylcysteine decarboxylase
MARIVLGVTGSVAAIRAPALFAALRGAGHAVRVVATEPSLHFFDPADLGPADPAGGPLFRDADEWAGVRYRRDDPVLHIVFRNWADLLIVAPLDANTLAKFALGLSDNFLTCLFRAWDFAKPVILAPAMNTLMWDSPVTLRHLARLLADRGEGHVQGGWTLGEAAEVFARHAPRLILVPPQAKRLACGDVGVGAMAEVVTIAEAVRGWAELAESAGGDPANSDPAGPGIAAARSPGASSGQPITVEIAAGELVDKLTILAIKSERITDGEKLRNVHAELDALRAAYARSVKPCEELAALTAELKKVNERLWEVEDAIRACERAGDFGPRFVALARSVYQHNDRRAAIKRRINEQLGSRLMEEKSYS